MLKTLKKYLTPALPGDNTDTVTVSQRIHVATCALLLEMAKADENFSIREKTTIREILEKDLNIPKEDIDEIMEMAARDREETVDLYEYTSFIDRVYSREEKQTLIELIWKVIYADGVLDQYEDYLVHKLADLLHLDHDDLIAAKIKMRPEGYKGR